MISAYGRVSDKPLALTVSVKMHDTNSYWSTEKQHTWLASARFSNFRSQVFLKNSLVLSLPLSKTVKKPSLDKYVSHCSQMWWCFCVKLLWIKQSRSTGQDLWFKSGAWIHSCLPPLEFVLFWGFLKMLNFFSVLLPLFVCFPSFFIIICHTPTRIFFVQQFSLFCLCTPLRPFVLCPIICLLCLVKHSSCECFTCVLLFLVSVFFVYFCQLPSWMALRFFSPLCLPLAHHHVFDHSFVRPEFGYLCFSCALFESVRAHRIQAHMTMKEPAKLMHVLATCSQVKKINNSGSCFEVVIVKHVSKNSCSRHHISNLEEYM